MRRCRGRVLEGRREQPRGFGRIEGWEGADGMLGPSWFYACKIPKRR